MRHPFLFFILFFLSQNIIAVQPLWITKTPKHNDPDHYYLYVAHGNGISEDDALVNAENNALMQAYGSTGAQKDATIRHALYTYYGTRDRDGSISVYCLYIIANTAEFYKNSETFWGGVPSYIPNKPDRDDIKPFKTIGRPQYWDKFKGSSYLVEEGTAFIYDANKEGSIRDSLLLSLETKLRHRTTLPNAIEFSQIKRTDCSYDKKAKTLHAVVYVHKNQIAEQYKNIIENALQLTSSYIHTAKEKEEVIEEDAEWLVIRSLYENAQSLCDTIRVAIIPQFQLYESNKDYVENTKKTFSSLSTTISQGLSYAKEKSQSCYATNLQEWLQIASNAEKQQKLATALQYYYGTLIYWNEKIDDRDNAVKMISLNGIQGLPLKRWLRDHIISILSDTKIYSIRQNKSEVKIVLYWSDESPVANFAYWYNLGNGESKVPRLCQSNYDLIDCRESINRIQIRIDYRSTDQMGNRALSNIIEQYSHSDLYNFDQYATHTVTIEDKHTFSQTHNNLYQSPVDEASNYVTNTANIYSSQAEHQELTKIIDPDQRKIYEDIITAVCNGINKQDIQSTRQLFTSKGYEQFKKLIFQTPITVRNSTQYDLLSCWNEVYARSIPATIRYKSRTAKEGNLVENLVFVFDSTKLIDGIQFAMDGKTVQEVFSHNDWNVATRFAIVNFLENYRTAYALKRLDYIQDVFADDAIIIIGRVIKHQPTSTDGVNINLTKGQTEVRYSNPTKAQYLKSLERNFKANEWININFNSAAITQPKSGPFGINLQQDYSSQHYSDKGYLFLVVDLDSLQRPVIHLRVWTPDGKCDWSWYEKYLETSSKKKMTL